MSSPSTTDLLSTVANLFWPSRLDMCRILSPSTTLLQASQQKPSALIRYRPVTGRLTEKILVFSTNLYILPRDLTSITSSHLSKLPLSNLSSLELAKISETFGNLTPLTPDIWPQGILLP